MRSASADVPDLVQEVFLRLLRVEDYASIRNPQAYLYTMASHVLHQHMVRQSMTPGSTQTLEPSLEISESSQVDPAVELELEQRFESVARGLAEVSPRSYATLMMCRCDGLPLKEIAVRLGVSHSMAKKYLARALSYCQRKLHEME
jgi:RNA polymerase sigma factor (sigma-70 family)